MPIYLLKPIEVTIRSGNEISIIAKNIVVEEIVSALAFAIYKKLSFNLIRSMHLITDLWDSICTVVHADLHFH